jgi:hypothetical protein
MTDTADAKPDYQIAREELTALMRQEGITVGSVFVPFSRSRNNDQRITHASLNWQVTIRKGDLPILSKIDYSAGLAHCPAYTARYTPGTLRWTTDFEKAIRHEVETGYRYRGSLAVTGNARESITPDPVDVFSSCLNDADAINCATFEEWAGDYGYDTDSRQAEATYRACLAIGLALRAGLGDDLMRQARELAGRL